ncbi:hypothetical protein [Oceanobacillus senegalensis]|uniref:hypothetical protein n=1 Tax=Oceanobacillus senegalensis TaxID=1936063 RepID=UPI000A3116FA|nr:hypothetical protein [Oceanobacillus senegalensis]
MFVQTNRISNVLSNNNHLTPASILQETVRQNMANYQTLNVKLDSPLLAPHLGVRTVQIRIDNVWYIGVAINSISLAENGSRKKVIKLHIKNFNGTYSNQHVVINWSPTKDPYKLQIRKHKVAS